MARGKGASDQRLLTPLPGMPGRSPEIPGDPRRPPDEFQIGHFICVFTAQIARASLRCNIFLTFSYPSHLKHLVLIVFLEDGLPERLSKLGVLAERGMKKSKKHHAIAPIAKTPRKVPGRENSDCENTMNMKLANRKSRFYLAFCQFLRSSFHFDNVLQ